VDGRPVLVIQAGARRSRGVSIGGGIAAVASPGRPRVAPCGSDRRVSSFIPVREAWSGWAAGSRCPAARAAGLAVRLGEIAAQPEVRAGQPGRRAWAPTTKAQGPVGVACRRGGHDGSIGDRGSGPHFGVRSPIRAPLARASAQVRPLSRAGPSAARLPRRRGMSSRRLHRQRITGPWPGDELLGRGWPAPPGTAAPTSQGES
jgi:hypothetical protein